MSNSCFVGNIRGVTTANANAIPVLIDSAGQLGTASSSRRFKKEIKPMESTPAKPSMALKPVTFHYKSRHHGHAAIWADRRGGGRDKPGPGGAR